MWSGAQSAFSDFFQVNVDWLKTIKPKKQCWTSVTLKNQSLEMIQQQQPQERYFLVALKVRAIAQVFSSLDDLRKDRSDIPQCIFHYDPPNPAP